MNIILTEEKCYSLKTGDAVIDCMRVASHWNGMTELRGSSGEILIVRMEGGSGFEAFFDSIGKDKLQVRANVISGTPELLARISALP